MILNFVTQLIVNAVWDTWRRNSPFLWSRDTQSKTKERCVPSMPSCKYKKTPLWPAFINNQCIYVDSKRFLAFLAYSFHTRKGKTCTDPKLNWVMHYVNLLRWDLSENLTWFCHPHTALTVVITTYLISNRNKAQIVHTEAQSNNGSFFSSS